MTRSLLKVLLGVEERLALPPQRQPTGTCEPLSPLETAKPLLSLHHPPHPPLSIPPPDLSSDEIQGGQDVPCSLVARSCTTLLQPSGLSPTRLLCPWIVQARIPEWVVTSFSRASWSPIDRLEKPADSTHSSKCGLSPREQLERQVKLHSFTQDSQSHPHSLAHVPHLHPPSQQCSTQRRGF